MRDAIKSSLIIAMADALDVPELAAAVRILARLIEKKGGIPLKTIHAAAGVSKAEWDPMAEAVLLHFQTENGNVVLANAAHPIPSIAGQAKAPRKGVTPPMFPEVRAGAPKPESLPKYIASRPVPVSIRSAIYDAGIRVLIGAGISEKTARATIASWLKSYSEGAVAEAIADARQRTDLDDPHSWIVARLRAAARGVRMHPASAEAGERLPRAQPGDINGMSPGTFSAMIEQNKKLGAVRLGTRNAEHKTDKNTQ